MDKITLYEDDYLTIAYSEKGKYLLHTWQGFTSSETFCSLIDKAVDYLKEKKANGFIIDARKHRGVGDALQEYAAQKVALFEKENYPLKQALVVPENVFSSLAVENYSKKIKTGRASSKIAYFDKVEDAENWIVS